MNNKIIKKVVKIYPNKKIIEVEITQKMINEINKIRKELKLEPLKEIPHKFTYMLK